MAERVGEAEFEALTRQIDLVGVNNRFPVGEDFLSKTSLDLTDQLSCQYSTWLLGPAS